MASKPGVMHMQVLHTAAHLAAPAIALKRLLVEDAIFIASEASWRHFAEFPGHDASRLMLERNASCCCRGRKP